jgi:hypothetical protein
MLGRRERLSCRPQVLLNCRAMRLKQADQRIAEVFEQVPPICNLNRIWGALARAFRIGASVSIVARKCRAIVGNATERDRRQYYTTVCGFPHVNRYAPFQQNQVSVCHHLLLPPIRVWPPIRRPQWPGGRS